MRYKVTQTETIEYVLEATNETEAIDFIKSYTNRELRAVKPDIKTTYQDAIVEKTVMPADFHYDDEIEEIIDDWPGLAFNEDDTNINITITDGIDENLPFN